LLDEDGKAEHIVVGAGFDFLFLTCLSLNLRISLPFFRYSSEILAQRVAVSFEKILEK